MFLRHPFLVRAMFPAAFMLTLLSGNALATTYVIESTNDIVADDDVCTLREAVTASITLEASEDCEAGTGTDKIQLKEGLTYTLTQGELVVGGEIISELDINGDGDTTDAFLDDSARGGAGTQPLPLPLIPYTSGDPTKEKAPVAAVPGVDANTDGDFNDPGDTPPVLAEPGVDIDGDGAYDKTFIIVREYPERPINVSISFEVKPKDAFDKTIKENPTIVATNDARIFNVVTGSRISISNITLDGGVGTAGPAGNGGLILSEGSVVLVKRTQLINGVATNGGAIFIDAESASLSFDDVAFTNNTATANGGAFATSATYDGLVVGLNSYFEGNQAAQGGAIFLDGVDPLFGLENSTLYANGASGVDGGGAINFFAGSRGTTLNNVTIAGQAAGGGVSYGAEVGTVSDIISNSVIVGNVGGSCVGDSAAIAGAYGAYVVHQGGSCPIDVDGFVYVGPNPGDVISNNSGTADFSVLAYRDATTNLFVSCSQADGPTACIPIEFADAGWKGFVPSLVDSIGAADGVPTAFNSASPREATVDVCASKDQRQSDREDDCDAGAIELRAAKGALDEFTVVDGVSTLVDVLENDLGDTEVNCSLVPAADPCMVIDVQPIRGGAMVEIDVNNRPQIRYQSRVNFHGVDTFHYVLDKRAVSSLTYAGANVGAQVNMVVEPASGLTKSESIGNGSGTGTGSFSLFSGLLLLLAGLLRARGQRYLRVFVAIVLSAAASNSLFAEVITVNSLSDQATYGDGQCTLREAINNATDSAPLFSPDCASGATGRDTIELPDGVLTLTSELVVPTNTSLDIVGTGADVDANDATGTTIDGDNVTRLFLASSSLLLKNMTLRNGNAAGEDGGVILTSANLTLEGVLVSANTAANGGAIYLNYNTGLSRTLNIKRSQFTGNSAALDGGVLSMSGQRQKHTLLIDSSSFIGNSATGKGGALDVNLPPLGGSLNVLNSTFASNTAATGDAIDLTDVAAPVAIMNSTFLDQDVAIDVGNIDSAVVRVQMHNSIYAGALASNACSTGTGTFTSSDYNLYGTTDTTCIKGPNDNSQAYADIRSVLSAGVATPAAGEGDEFVPSHYAVNDADPNSIWVLDVGDGTTNDLADGATSPTKCRTVDTRGAARTSGGRCDIGAFEFQVATAVADTGSNAGRGGSFAIIDVLENDLVGESGFLVTYAIDLDTTNNGAQSPSEVDTGNAPGPSIVTPDKGAAIRLVAKEDVRDPQQDCGANVGANGPDAPAECVLRYEAPVFSNCTDLNDYSDTFEYTVVINDQENFTGINNVKALSGEVTVTLINAPPDADDVTRKSEPGRIEILPFDPVDPEGFSSITDYEVTQAPINAKYEIVDQKKIFLGVGIIVNEAAGTVTYIPGSNLSPFDDRFQLSYKDECGATGNTTFIIDYPREDASGDVLGGSISFAFSTFGLLLALRRKQVKK